MSEQVETKAIEKDAPEVAKPAPNAIIVKEELTTALLKYLYSKPMGEVRGLVIGLEQSTPVHVKQKQ